MQKQYILDNPSSKVLSNYLATLIRLQRHKGVCVVISTQEPTVSTNLIALCLVTVIYRFTSPAWYLALKKHISAIDNYKDIMREIKGLKTGAALVYALNAVLGKDKSRKVIKATRRLLSVDIRSQITRDGGESIIAV
jgi:hypothetical protein